MGGMEPWSTTERSGRLMALRQRRGRVRPIKQSSKWFVVLLIVAGLGAMQLSACSSDSSENAAADEPASVEPIKGTSYNTITLSAEAEQRLGIKTATVAEKHGQEVIPYAAVS